MIIAFILGAVCASVVWFFVWRNNKKKFVDTLNDINVVVTSVEENSELADKVKEKVDGFFNKFKK